MFAADAPVDRERLEALLEALELGSLCAHGGGMPAPIRSLLAHFPDELGLRMSAVDRSTATSVEVEPGATVLEAARAAGRCVPTLCFDERQAPFGACRVCLVGVEGAPGPIPACTTPCRDGMAIDTAGRRPRAGSPAAVVELVLSELPEPPGAAHRARRRRARGSGRRAALARRDARAAPRRRATPTSRFRHELCISCGRCVRACDEVQGTFALTATGRGFEANIAAGLDAGLPRLGLRLLRRLRRHLPDRRDHRDLACSTDEVTA